MGLPIPIIDSIIDAGKTIIDKIWMDKGDKEKLELTKEELRRNFDIAMRKLAQEGKLSELEQAFKEHEAQRQFANDQFGTAESLERMGIVGRIVILGRASIRWIITGGSMYFTWNLINKIFTDAMVASLVAGTLGASGSAIIGLIITLVVGIPVFYATGISVEKIMKVRNKF